MAQQGAVAGTREGARPVAEPVSTTARIAGAALIVGSILLLAGNILHPRESFTGNILPTQADAYARLIVESGSLYPLSHVAVLVSAVTLALGFVALYGSLSPAGAQEYALPGVVAVATGSLLLLATMVLDGFVKPVQAQAVLSAPEAARELLIAQFQTVDLIGAEHLRFAFFGWWIGAGLVAAALHRANLYGRYFAWAGIALAAVGLVGYAVGIFGSYWVLSPVFAPYAVAFTVWFLVLGAKAWRSA